MTSDKRSSVQFTSPQLLTRTDAVTAVVNHECRRKEKRVAGVKTLKQTSVPPFLALPQRRYGNGEILYTTSII